MLIGAPEGTTELLRSQLAQAGFETGLRRSADRPVGASFDADAAIVFDNASPSATAVIRSMRENHPDTPVFVLLTSPDPELKKGALDAGAHDVFLAPMSVTQVASRVIQVLRAEYPQRLASVLVADGVELDRERHLVVRKGKLVHLRPLEFKLLELLMRTPGKVYSRADLLTALWGDDPNVRERAVDVQMMRMRDSLNRGLKDDPISAVRGQGYSVRPSKRTK